MRVAIVNDLALAREVLRQVVLSLPGFSIAWTALDGTEAVKKAIDDRPDAILMDLVMAPMDGAEATRQIMQRSPCPVLVVTATVPGHFDLVYKAIEAGALDAVETPTFGPGGTILLGERLAERLLRLNSTIKGSQVTPITFSPTRPLTGELPPIVAIGASTGGPAALPIVLAALPARFHAAVIIAQHLDAEFIPGLATRLGAHCRIPVRIAREGEIPGPGVVLLAATNDHLELGPDRRLRHTPVPRSAPYRPSADVLFSSLAVHCRHHGVGVVLTGMGNDGAEGLLQLRRSGWHTIAQDEASSVVYGMPRAAHEIGAAVEVLPLTLIGTSIVARLRPGKT